MGNLTALQIIQQGTLQAGRDDADTLALGWLNRWLSSIAAAWPWPVLARESNGLTVSASITVGNASGGVTEKILRILDNTWIYPADRSSRSTRVRIRTQLTSPNDRVGPSTAPPGKPTQARVFQSTFGQWVMYFDHSPDITYNLSLAYLALPAQIVATSETPWYMNDETMVQAVAFNCHRYFDGKDSPKTQAVQEDLAALTAADRLRYGSANGINDKAQLNVVRFRNADRP